MAYGDTNVNENAVEHNNRLLSTPTFLKYRIALVAIAVVPHWLYTIEKGKVQYFAMNYFRVVMQSRCKERTIRITKKHFYVTI